MRVDFYILQGEQRREITACRLCEKAYQQGHKVFIHADSPRQAQELDTLLWTFREGSFLPHRVANQTGRDIVPPAILIGWNGMGEPEGYPVLLNLAADVPPFFGKFDRIAEIVNQSEDIKAAGRQRFAFYREHGCNLHHHDH
jgi:DNA polymerase-3 subunit chi